MDVLVSQLRGVLETMEADESAEIERVRAVWAERRAAVADVLASFRSPALEHLVGFDGARPLDSIDVDRDTTDWAAEERAMAAMPALVEAMVALEQPPVMVGGDDLADDGGVYAGDVEPRPLPAADEPKPTLRVGGVRP